MIGKLLLFIFLFGFILLALMGFSVVRMFKRIFFGASDAEQPRRQSSSRRQRKSQTNNGNISRKKIFPKNEGEYVDYEEVK